MHTDLPEGARVLVTRDDDSTYETRTRSKPWQLGHGAWVVALIGRAGGYALERVQPLDTSAPMEDRHLDIEMEDRLMGGEGSADE